jgi:hypothetical protein
MRVVQLSGSLHVVQGSEFFEQVYTASVLRRAHALSSPHRKSKGIDLCHMRAVVDFARVRTPRPIPHNFHASPVRKLKDP